MSHSILIFTFLSLLSFAYAESVYDGFESEELSGIWSANRMVPEALKIEREVVRKGASAIKITVHPGDRYIPAEGESKASERDEISEAAELMSRLGRAYSYQFSLYIPKDFPIVPTRLVLAQWKQECPPLAICSPDNPVVALRYVSGKLYVTVQGNGPKQVIYQSHDDMKGRWLDFKFDIRFAREKDGFVNVWLGDKRVGNFKGPTAYATVGGYPDKAFFYFKMGLYRDVMNEPMTIYIDEYRKIDLPDNP